MSVRPAKGTTYSGWKSRSERIQICSFIVLNNKKIQEVCKFEVLDLQTFNFYFMVVAIIEKDFKKNIF